MKRVAEFINDSYAVGGFQFFKPFLDEEIKPKNFYPANHDRALVAEKPLNILLAEDDQLTREYLVDTLRNEGFEVSWARDGEEALEYALFSKALGTPFDLLLLDLQMPKLDGYGVAATLRYKNYTGPIIALTGRPLSEDRQMHKEVGCNYFIIKSELHRKLLPAITKCLSRH